MLASVLEPGSILRGERLGHLFDDVFRCLAGKKREIVGIERLQDRRELVAIEFAKEGSPHRFARFDQ